MALTDADIVARLVATEDGTVERKTISDNRDWIKAAVAFSNSLQNDQPGVLFVGVFDDGRIQDKPTNFEELQKRISGELSNIYPPIYPTILVREKDGKKFIAVIVYGSPERPHFAGKSYVRNGTKTDDASEANIQEFIAKRNSKVAEILKWKDKTVTLHTLHLPEAALRVGRVATTRRLVVNDCNSHWVTLKDAGNSPPQVSYTLKRIELNFDHEKQSLLLEIYPD
jgi:predicted HTH transcriptional regulator